MGILEKSIKINKDPSIYGTLAEIGAGQEVAHSLFKVGGASGTIAKTMSAYDMNFSDAIYGSDHSYVCKQRLIKMLNKELQLLQSRLSDRADKTRFFVFANTVATGSLRRKIPGHGWLGVLFQHKPQTAVSQVIIHVRIAPLSPTAQQSLIGIIGINLLYACFKYFDQLGDFFNSLTDQIDFDLLSVDYIDFLGSCFKYVDNKKLSLQLVKRKLSKAIMFDENAQLAPPSVNFYDKYLVAALGNFRPITVNKLAVMQAGYAKHRHLHGVPTKKLIYVAGLSLDNINHDLKDDFNGDFNQDHLFNELYARIKMLAKLGISVVVSNFRNDFDFSECLNLYSSKPKALVIGSHCLSKVLDQSQYRHFTGGLFEALGFMVSHNTILYIYPVSLTKNNLLKNKYKLNDLSYSQSDQDSQTLDRNKKLILDYMKNSGLCYDLEKLKKISFKDIIALENIDYKIPDQKIPAEYLPSSDVLALIRSKHASWQDHVPSPILEFVSTDTDNKKNIKLS